MIEDLIHARVPDVFGLPVYVVPTSDLPVPGEFLSAGAVGMSGCRLDLELQTHLESRDLWRGRGPAIVVDDDQSDDEIIATVIHEMAHYLESDFDLTEPTFQEIEAAAEVGMIGRSLWSNFSELELPRFFAHELPFLRNCLHLHARFTAADAYVPVRLIIDSEEYGLSAVGEYIDALGDEPARLAALSFATIRLFPPPAEFVKLWKADVRKTFLSRADCPPRWASVCLAELTKFRS